MEYWVSKLREQAAQIISGEYQPGNPVFSRAPDGMADLSRDLDRLAQLMAKREAARLALEREVHHRVRNNLQIITSLLEMQASRIENPAVGEALGQTRARIAALALIHRIFYEQADDGSEPTFAVARLFTELCKQFHQWHRGRREVAFTCHADALAVPMDNALPLALFAVEAVTNAYAYAFPHGRTGNVNLRFSVVPDGRAVLSVTDDGAGFDISANGHSLGRQLMHGFARQLGGAVTILSSAATGTEARLEYRPGA